jgi:3-methyladenine DNA glycosylase AlkD
VRKLAKQIERDQALAEQLWRTGNQDARTLAALIADPKAMSPADLDRWARDLNYYVVADLFSNNVAAGSPAAGKKAEEWTASGHEYVCQAGWDLVAVIALKSTSLPDEYFEAWLENIEHGIHGAKNRPRHAMNGALIAIGLRNEGLRAQAEAVAARIGKVEVDHGETGCVTPDATAYIARAWTRRRQG